MFQTKRCQGILFLLAFLGSTIICRGQGLPSITGNPGDLLWESDTLGGRVATFHRGYYMVHSSHQGSTYVLDLMPLANNNPPNNIGQYAGGSNGHAWFKFGDAYKRGYSMPEFGNAQLVDLSDMSNITTFSGTLQYDYSCPGCPVDNDRLGTYPFAYYSWANQIKDVRSNVLHDGTPDLRAGLGLGGEIMIGNLLFSLPLGPVDGLTIWDVGDPANPRLLGLMTNPLSNYPDGWAVYKNHIMLTTGDDSNEGGNNMVAVDFSDPANPNVAFGFDVSEIGPARYSVYQDNYGFVANGSQWHKIDMENQTVQRFTSPGTVGLGDFWPLAMGNMVAFIEGQTTVDRLAIFLHDANPDTQGPTVGYHVPANRQTGYSRSSGVGMVINECLAGETVTSENIIVTRCSDDTVIPGAVVHTSYGTVQWVPDALLDENTAYNVSITSGLRDCAGNGATPYQFSFSTGATNDCPNTNPGDSSDDNSGGSDNGDDNSNDNGNGGGGDDGGESINTPPSIVNLSASAQNALTGSSLTFTAQATDSDGDNLTYRWDFGDGSIIEWSDQAGVDHTYTTPGNFRVLVQIQDGNATTSDFISINVSLPIPDTPSQHSSPIVIDEVNRQVWVVNPDNNSITSIDADNLTLDQEITVGLDPTSIALDDEGRLWVTCRDSDEVWIMESSTGGTIEVVNLDRGSRPYAIVEDPSGTNMYVSETGSGRLRRIATDNIDDQSSIALGPTPRALTINASGTQLLVSRMISGQNGGSIYSVTTSPFESVEDVTLAIDESSPPTSGVAGPGIPNYVAGLAYNPAGTEISYVSKKDNIFNGTHENRNGVEFTFERTVRSIIGQIGEDQQESVSGRLDIDDMAQPSSIAYSPTGNMLLVTMQGNNLLIVLDAFTRSEIARATTGLAPQGVAVDAQTQRIFTKDFMGRTVSVFDGASVLAGNSSQLSLIETIPTVQEELLSEDVLLGKRIFYNADDPRMTQQGDQDNGYISCASCHIDGTHDGVVWDFTQRGEGLRNTTSLVGRAGDGHGRIHWTGNFDEVQDFEHDVRNAFGGSGFMNNNDFDEGTRNTTLGDTKESYSEDLDALAAYLRSLNSFDPSPCKPSDNAFSDDAVRGRTLFSVLDCANCHAGASFTNSSKGLVADVGTLNDRSGNRLGQVILGLDVPTLKDVWATAPYLHDGSAATLRDVMDEHLGFETLTETQKQYLVSYLQQLDGSEASRGAGTELSLNWPRNGDIHHPEDQILLSISTDLTNEEVVETVYYANGEIVASTEEEPFQAFWQPMIEDTFDIQVSVRLANGMSISTVDRMVSVSTSRLETPLSVTEDIEIELYPNSTSRLLHIRGRLTMGTIIEVRDLTGRPVFSKAIDNRQSVQVDLQSLKKGIYLVRVGANAAKRIIVR